jgi:hypothetical protein
MFIRPYKICPWFCKMGSRNFILIKIDKYFATTISPHPMETPVGAAKNRVPLGMGT